MVSDAGYFSLDDIDKVPEGVNVIMPSRKQAQKENKKTQGKPFGTEEFHYNFYAHRQTAQNSFGTVCSLNPAFPVVDECGRLVGIARANDFIENTMAIERKVEIERDDLLKIIGIQLEEFRKPTIFKSTLLRFPYLLFNISSGLAYAFLFWLRRCRARR